LVRNHTQKENKTNKTTCVNGACVKGSMLVGCVMASELFPAVYRTFAGTVIEMFWVAAWMLLALLAYLIRDWKYLQLAITLLGVPTIPLIW